MGPSVPGGLMRARWWVDRDDVGERERELRLVLERGPARQREATDTLREVLGPVRRVCDHGEYGLAGGHEVREQPPDPGAAQIPRGAARLLPAWSARGQVAFEFAEQTGRELGLAEEVDRAGAAALGLAEHEPG